MIAEWRLAHRRGSLAIQICYGLLAICLVGCSSSPAPSAAAHQSPPAARSSPPADRVIETWYDAVAVAELAAAWDVFDKAEQGAIARHEAALGRYVDTLSMPVDDFTRQVAGRTVRQPHDEAWLREQRRRDGPARSERVRTIEHARTDLQHAAATAVVSFLDRELRNGRIAPADHARLSGKFGRAGFPPMRLRKWTGPQPVDFLNTPYAGAIRLHGNDYKAVIQEARRVWLAHARGLTILSRPANERLYRSLQ